MFTVTGWYELSFTKKIVFGYGTYPGNPHGVEYMSGRQLPRLGVGALPMGIVC